MTTSGPPRDQRPGTGILVVMGVSGSGKTTVGRLLAQGLETPFVEADRLHSPANVAKMASGQPLNDGDRWPWLDAVAAEALCQEAGNGVVIACSALKRSYRARLAAVLGAPLFIYLSGSPQLLRARMAAREGHFMPTSLLDSQLATLEPPAADENALVVDIGPTPEAIVAGIVETLHHG
jgi:gluconokinase